jgi:tetratricopeptide (TPR) repeat protein
MLGVRICLIIALGMGSTSIAAAASQNQISSDQVETSNPEAYDAFKKGWEHYRRETPADFGKAASYFEQAIQLDPDYARAHSAMAAVYWNSTWRSWAEPFGFSTYQMMDRSRIYLKRAMQSPSALSHQIASEMAAYYSKRSAKKAFAEADAAIALDENDPAGYLAKANAFLKAKKPGEAIASMQHAMSLNPDYPASYLTRLGRAQFAMGQYAEAAATLERATELNPEDDRAYTFLAATYGHLGRKAEAKSAIDSVDRIRSEMRWGNITIRDINRWRWMGDRKRLKEGFTLAGVDNGYKWYSRVNKSGSGVEVEGATPIGIEQAKKLYDEGVPFIDVSRIGVQGKIRGAHNLPMGIGNEMGPAAFNEIRLKEIASESGGMVIYHPNGSPSRIGAIADSSAEAAEYGFRKVYYLQDSLDDWEKAGYPLETDQ